MHDELPTLSLSEFVAVCLAAITAIIIVNAYLIDLGGWPIDPLSVLLVVVTEIALLSVGLWRVRQRWRIRITRGETIGWGLSVAGLFLAILWLAQPTFLPLSQSSDLIHHLSLIDFIQHRHRLPHDLSLQPYLGEMVVYSPGSHLLTALLADWLNTASLRLIHPLLAFLVALKAGFVYHSTLRLLPNVRHSPVVAVCSVIFLLFMWGYFLLSFLGHFYFAQVVAETFAVAMLWATVAFDQRPSGLLLGFWALCSIAIFLVWPFWLPSPLLAMVGLLILKRDLSFIKKARALISALGPVGILIILDRWLNQLPGSDMIVRSILTNEGVVLRPSLELFGRPLLILVMIGLIAHWRSRMMLPLWLFSAAWAIQASVLLFIALERGISSYFFFKMFHLLVYPLAIWAALGLATLLDLFRRRWPTRASRLTWPVLLGLVVIIVAVLAMRRDPLHQPVSAINEPVYIAGQWAKGHLPSPCIEYIVDHWLTAYWIHINLLGNPRTMSRTEQILYDFPAYRAFLDDWLDRPGLPFAIITDINTLPGDERVKLRVLYEVPPAAIVQRTNEAICSDQTVPLDQVAVAPRTNTLAYALSVVFTK